MSTFAWEANLYKDFSFILRNLKNRYIKKIFFSMASEFVPFKGIKALRILEIFISLGFKLCFWHCQSSYSN